MRRILSLVVLLLVACGKTSSEETPEEGGPTGGIHGSLRVHYQHPGAADALVSVYALLGDGSQFRVPLDVNGEGRFEDPSLTGPQDISIVVTDKSPELDVQVYTVLGFDQPELWLYSQPTPGAQQTTQATLTGKVTGASAGNSVSLSVVGSGFSGWKGAVADGSFSVDALGTAPGEVSLLATESADNAASLVRVGMRRGISVGGGHVLAGQDVTLDHPVDQLLEVGVEGLEPYDSQVRASLTFYEGDIDLFETQARGAVPVRVPTLARTPPFDTSRVFLGVGAGSLSSLPAGRVEMTVPVASSEPTMSVKLPSPMLIASPALGTDDAPATASRAGLVLRWTADPGAQLMQVQMVDGSVDWTIMAPLSITSFTPFTLPAEVAPYTTLTTGLYMVEASSLSRGNSQGFADYFSSGAGSLMRAPAMERSTRLRGYVTLQ